MRQLDIKMWTHPICDCGRVVGSYFHHRLGSLLRIPPSWSECGKRAANYHLVHLPFVFICFQILVGTLNTNYIRSGGGKKQRVCKYWQKQPTWRLISGEKKTNRSKNGKKPTWWLIRSEKKKRVTKNCKKTYQGSEGTNKSPWLSAPL